MNTSCTFCLFLQLLREVETCWLYFLQQYLQQNCCETPGNDSGNLCCNGTMKMFSATITKYYLPYFPIYLFQINKYIITTLDLQTITDLIIAEPTQKNSLFSFKVLLYGIPCLPTLPIQKPNFVSGKDF